MDANDPLTLLGRMPKHRARRRSPLRSGSPASPAPGGPTPDPFGKPKPVDAEAAAAVVEGVKALAEVVDIALTATALVLREIEAKLPPPARPELPSARQAAGPEGADRSQPRTKGT